MNDGKTQVICLECGTAFQTDKPWRQFCSDECRERNFLRNQRVLEETERCCVVCGKRFLPMLRSNETRCQDCRRNGRRPEAWRGKSL